MQLSDFDFLLPPDRIAQRPAEPRDSARLLVVGQALEDRRVSDLPLLLRPGDLLVFNNTRVIPARLLGRSGAARVEVTLHLKEGAGRWWAFARPARKLAAHGWFEVAPDCRAQVVARGEGGELLLDFACEDAALLSLLDRYGKLPLPPYIRRPAGADRRDAADYQTVFAEREGAVAAPTAGLHFTPELLARLAERGIRRAEVTLHVGAGTFLPVKVQQVEKHRLHAEHGEIEAAAAAAVNEAKAAGGRIVAVGTTALRLLEAAARPGGGLAPFAGKTDLFILPGYRFKLVDLLLTNFHLPKSTLFMLVSAFAGRERIRAAYAHAIAGGYRFFSYGDATLLEPAS